MTTQQSSNILSIMAKSLHLSITIDDIAVKRLQDYLYQHHPTGKSQFIGCLVTNLLMSATPDLLDKIAWRNPYTDPPLDISISEK